MGLAADRVRDRVDHAFHREAHAGARDATERHDRRLVGAHRPGAVAERREVVGARQDAADLRRLQAGRERVDRVGAGVDRGLGVERQQLAVLVGVGGQLVVVLARVGGGDQMLAAILDPAHRAVEMARQPAEADLLGLQQALPAEAAADVGRDHADALLRDAQALRQAVAHDVRHLGRGGEHELVEPVVPLGDCSFSLQGRHALARHAEGALDHHGRRCHRGVELADHRRGLEEDVVGPVLVDERRTRADRRAHVGVDGQCVEPDADRRRDVLGGGARVGDAHRDRLADEA